MENYLSYIKRDTFISAFFFLISCLIGYLYAALFPEETIDYLNDVKTFFGSFDDSTPLETFFAIFENNTRAMLNIVCLGLFAGFFSLTFLLVNGFVIGLLGYIFFQEGSWLLFLAGIIPHGIIEIPCMLFSAAIGFKIGSVAVKKILRKNVDLTQEVARGLEFSATVVIPLLFAAAFIETYVTPYFMLLVEFIPV